jgi:hypothetical protein
MNRRIFKHDVQNDFFRKNGYVHLTNFLTAEEIIDLKNLYYEKEYTNFLNGFHRTLDMPNSALKLEICAGIKYIVTRQAKKYLSNYKYFLTSFMTKEPGAAAFDIHQNWSFVEEDKYTSLVIWIPLQDTDEVNGTMQVIPGSNNYPKGKRGNNITWKYENIKQELINEYLVSINMKAGDAIMFDDATIHYTSSNQEKEPRISIAQVMIPEEAQPIFYNNNMQKNRLEKFLIDKDFYHFYVERYIPDMNFGKDCKLVEEEPLFDEKVGLDDFKRLYHCFNRKDEV